MRMAGRSGSNWFLHAGKSVLSALHLGMASGYAYDLALQSICATVMQVTGHCAIAREHLERHGWSFSAGGRFAI